ncbi:MAG: dTDP-4-dehydrorhamnose reductase [Verrucomicrobiales bacterium]|nr:dTDP-4-dehydrorhamnose reductase [Verrucomicrobiales bacterium]
MMVLLGGTGYLGSAFAAELQGRGVPFVALSRAQVDYSRFEVLLKYLQEHKPEFVINAAGYTGKPNVDACEVAQADTLQGNTLLPLTIAQACAAAQVPWGHVSSGCIYAGAKVRVNGVITEEKDLTRPELRALVAQAPQSILGFTEKDPPNFSFRAPPCSFYSGTKALAEEAISGLGQSYIWRLRIPFDGVDNPRNYLSKVQRYPKVYDNVNSISHRTDFVRACLDLWALRAPFGTYNVVNPGFLTTRQVVETLQRTLKLDRSFEFWASDQEFYRVAAKTPRSNCVLDTTKLLAAGVKIRPVEAALADALQHWRKEG